MQTEESKTAQQKGKKLRLVALDKKEYEIYVLRTRPTRVYVKRAFKLLMSG